MTKSKVPVARIEGADGAPAAQERQTDVGNGASATLKAGSASATAVDTPAVNGVDQPAEAAIDTPREAPADAPAPQASVSDEQVAVKPAQEKRGERPRMKIVADPVTETYAEAGQPSASASEARAAYAEAAAAYDGVAQPTAEPRADAAEAPQGRLAWLTSIFNSHRYAALGGVCGLVVALLVFFVGFWKTLFICLLVLVGVAFGQYLDGDPKIVNRIRELVIEARGNN